MKRTELARKPRPTNPYSSLPRRTSALSSTSARARSERAGQQRVYREMDAESNGCCFTCKQWGPTEHSHVLPQGMNKMERANPANIVPDCPACHRLWGEKLPEYARRYPEALAAKVALMKQVNRQRWAFWMMKNDYLLKLK